MLKILKLLIQSATKHERGFVYELKKTKVSGSSLTWKLQLISLKIVVSKLIILILDISIVITHLSTHAELSFCSCRESGERVKSFSVGNIPAKNSRTFSFLFIENIHVGVINRKNIYTTCLDEWRWHCFHSKLVRFFAHPL